MKRRHLLLEDVRRDCHETACEPRAEQGSGIAAVKERSPVTLQFLFVRRSRCHPDNFTTLLSFANVPDIVTTVMTIPSEVYPVPVQVTKIAACLAIFALSNVMTNVALVEYEVAAVRANLTRIAAKVAAL
jgi:hypothetical protein